VRDAEIDWHFQLEIERYSADVGIVETQEGLSSEYHSVATDELCKLDVKKEVIHWYGLPMDDKVRVLLLHKDGLGSKQTDRRATEQALADNSPFSWVIPTDQNRCIETQPTMERVCSGPLGGIHQEIRSRFQGHCKNQGLKAAYCPSTARAKR
jgi:hypothetical protein